MKDKTDLKQNKLTNRQVKVSDMQIESKNKIYTVEEYIKHEWTAERRSEFINGQLYEMAGEKDINKK